MSHLWFVENRAQAKWVRDCPQEVANCTVVAQTAEALQALEEFGIRHCAVAEYADTRLIAEVSNQLQSDCFDLMTEIEDYIISHYDDAEISDTGYLTAHIYWVYHAVITLATRAHLWQETIRACRPSKISIFKVVTDESYMFRTPHPWYPSLPMSSLLRQFESLYSFRFDVRSYDLRESRVTVGSQTQSSLNFLRLLPRRAGRFVARKFTGYLSKNMLGRGKAGSNREISNLFVIGGVNDEWLTVISRLEHKISGYGLGWVNNGSLENDQGCQGWSTVYDNRLVATKDHSVIDLDFAEYRSDEVQTKLLTELYNRWARRVTRTPLLNFNGLDLAEDLIAILKPLATHGISLVRYIDCVASRVLDHGMPDVVCFCGVIHMADKRMVNACRKRGIPTVGIQHGGSVGTHERSMAEICGVGWCDYYLTYGDGIKASDVSIVPISIVPTRASLIPVGSPVIEKRTSGMRKHKTSYGECVRVLWITDKSYGNTVGHDNRLEDTSRYLLHKRCLEMLGKCTGVELTLRPFKSTEEMLGTVRWINSDTNLDVRIDAISSLDDLLTENDLVITDNSASTVWNEAIVFGKPLILFCDPEQTILMHDFIRDLEQSCCWCRTEKELIDAIEKLIREGSEYVRELSQIDTSEYIKKYVLHSDDCRAIDRAVRFLLELNLPLVTLPATMESS